MSMTELERRCVERYERDAPMTVVQIIRAVLAEAGVAELVEALNFYAANHDWPNEGPWGVDSTDFGDVARAALTKIGANQ